MGWNAMHDSVVYKFRLRCILIIKYFSKKLIEELKIQSDLIQT